MDEYKLHTPSYYLNKNSSNKTSAAAAVSGRSEDLHDLSLPGGENPRAAGTTSDQLDVLGVHRVKKVDATCLDKEVESYLFSTTKVCLIIIFNNSESMLYFVYVRPTR